jgi:hypothetical protein
MAILLHGTTRQRAEQILAHGPDPDFTEPGGVRDRDRAETFWTCLASGPFDLGTPEEYARRKAALFQNEGGPAIVVVDVPDDLLALTDQVFFPLTRGVVPFEEGTALAALRAAWPTLSRQIRMVERS